MPYITIIELFPVPNKFKIKATVANRRQPYHHELQMGLKKFYILWGIGCLLAIASIVLVLFGRRENNKTLYSPDKTKQLIAHVNRSPSDKTRYLTVTFDVLDSQSNLIITHQGTGASDRSKWTVEWINDNTIKLNSIDIGTYCWHGADNWAKTTCY